MKGCFVPPCKRLINYESLIAGPALVILESRVWSIVWKRIFEADSPLVISVRSLEVASYCTSDAPDLRTGTEVSYRAEY